MENLVRCVASLCAKVIYSMDIKLFEYVKLFFFQSIRFYVLGFAYEPKKALTQHVRNSYAFSLMTSN